MNSNSVSILQLVLFVGTRYNWEYEWICVSSLLNLYQCLFEWRWKSSCRTCQGESLYLDPLIPTSWSFYCLQVPFLGCVPLEPQLALAAETGSSFVDQFADSQVKFCTMIHAKQISCDIETCYLTGCTELNSNIPGPSEWHWNCGGCSDGAMSFSEKNEWKIYSGWAFKKIIELYCSCNQEKGQCLCYQCALMCGPGFQYHKGCAFSKQGGLDSSVWSAPLSSQMWMSASSMKLWITPTCRESQRDFKQHG